MAWFLIAAGLARLAAHVCMEMDRGSSSPDNVPTNHLPDSNLKGSVIESGAEVSRSSTKGHVLRLCFSCGTQNRLPTNADEELTKCGKCKMPLSLRGARNPAIAKYVKQTTCPFCHQNDFIFSRQTDTDVDLKCNSCQKPYFVKKVKEISGINTGNEYVAEGKKSLSNKIDPPGLTIGYRTCRKCGYDYRESVGKCSRCT